MIHVYGIILLERTAIVIRIYEVNKLAWKLIHYRNFDLHHHTIPAVHQDALAEEISTKLAEFFIGDSASFVTQWKAGARGISHATCNFISSSLGLQIESITPMKEQELLCKGLFTELW